MWTRHLNMHSSCGFKPFCPTLEIHLWSPNVCSALECGPRRTAAGEAGSRGRRPHSEPLLFTSHLASDAGLLAPLKLSLAPRPVATPPPPPGAQSGVAAVPTCRVRNESVPRPPSHLWGRPTWTAPGSPRRSKPASVKRRKEETTAEN